MSNRKISPIVVACIIGAIVGIVATTSCTSAPSTQTHTINTDVNPPGAGSVSPSGGEYESGTQVTLTASPAIGYTFAHWSGDASGTTSSIIITLDSDKSLTAHFETTPTVPGVLFSDDFSDDNGGWLTFDDYDGRVMYSDGCLYVKDYTSSEGSIYSECQRYFTDFVLEVETWLVDGADDNWHTVFCRWNGEDDCYGFGISADGYYEIGKFVDAEMTSLVGPAYSAYIQKGQDMTNLIRIECIGSTLTLAVNGYVMATVTDATFSGGNIALAATALAGTFTEVAFDNIVVSEP